MSFCLRRRNCRLIVLFSFFPHSVRNSSLSIRSFSSFLYPPFPQPVGSQEMPQAQVSVRDCRFLPLRRIRFLLFFLDPFCFLRYAGAFIFLSGSPFLCSYPIFFFLPFLSFFIRFAVLRIRCSTACRPDRVVINKPCSPL